MPKPIQHFNLTQQNCAMAHFRMHNEHFIVLETPGGDYQAVQFVEKSARKLPPLSEA